MVFNWKMMNNIPHDLSVLDRIEIFNLSTVEAKKRIKSFDPTAHKGIRGHAAIIAGSHGMMGASILATQSCMRAGCGKTTAFVPDEYFSLLHSTVPEALVKSNNFETLKDEPYDAIAVGPGLGITPESASLLKRCLETDKPLVIDADGLNLLSKEKSLFNTIPKGSTLTPHHGEWEKLFGKSSSDSYKINTSIEFCNKLNINILLKGFFSVFITPYSIHINGTGNNGMGKGGSGDVLTGILASLLAQGYAAEDAGIIAMYVHGLAGDFAREHLGEDYMTASDIIHYQSMAFQTLRK